MSITQKGKKNATCPIVKYTFLTEKTVLNEITHIEITFDDKFLKDNK